MVVNAGDPKRAAEILVRGVKRQVLPTHLLLGLFAVDAAQNYSCRPIAEAEARANAQHLRGLSSVLPGMVCQELKEVRPQKNSRIRSLGTDKRFLARGPCERSDTSDTRVNRPTLELLVLRL